jgi:uncharacterized protein YjiS (DUF1127 family)
MRRQPRAGGQPAVSHIRGQRFGERAIARPVVTLEVRNPACHGDNFMIDLLIESQFDFVNLFQSIGIKDVFKDCIDTSRPTPIDPRSVLSRLAVSARQSPKLLRRLGEWRELTRSRRFLQQLDDRMLRDVGLSHADVARECTKHFWQR